MDNKQQILEELYKVRVFSPNEDDTCPWYYKVPILRKNIDVQVHDIIDGVLENMKKAEVIVPMNEWRSYAASLEYMLRLFLKPGQKQHTFVGLMRYLQQVGSYEGYTIDLTIKDKNGENLM